MNPAPLGHHRFGFLWRLFGLLFMIAGLSKISDPSAFLLAISAYHLPWAEGTSRILAISLPWFEFLIGTCLVAGVWQEGARYGMLGLLSLFTLATGQAWIRGLELSCGCFQLPGINANLLRILDSAPAATLRNTLLLSACLWLQWKGGSHRPLQDFPPRKK